MEPNRNLLVTPRWVDIINYVARHSACSITELSRGIPMTYSYSTKVMNELQDIGVLSIVKNGRRKSLLLTEKGEKVHKSIMILSELMKAGGTV